MILVLKRIFNRSHYINQQRGKVEKQLKVLLIEDSENDMKLICREIKKAGYDVHLSWIQNIDELKVVLENPNFDVIISDFNLSKCNGFDTLNFIQKTSNDIPFILASGQISEDIAVQVLKSGANDYIMKDKLQRLVPSIERAINDIIVKREHKQAQVALIESEKKFRRIFDNIQDIYYQTDTKGRILEVSPSVEISSDYKRAELINKNSLEFYVDRSVRKNLTCLLNENGEVRDFEIRLKDKSDKIITFSLNAHLTFDSNGIKNGTEGLLRDISERKQSEMEIVKALDKANESDRLKTAFLQNISHEIRTPLNGIIGFSNLLQEEDITKEEIKEFTNIIQNSGKRLIEIVNNVLDISKIEAGSVHIINKSFCLNTLIKSLHDFFLPIALSKNIVLSYNYLNNDDDSQIQSDEGKINQIMTNLINNAIKFTKSGIVDFGYKVINNEIEFYVKDSGIGIPEEMHRKVFERFIQGDLSISRGYEGSGLGLAICKGLVDILGGNIWVKSEVNIGSTFSFTIPYISSEE